MAKADNAELVFVPLGGVGEIGMNFALYGYGPANNREWIIIDVGVTFPDAAHPGVDLILPDTRFIEDKLAKLRGIVITHAHEDHYGALHDIWPKLKAPVWMTPFGAGLLEAKRQGEQNAPKIPVTIYRAGEKFTIGPFEIEAIPVAHSIPEPMSLAITTPVGTVIHTGDWKIDPAPSIGPMTDEARFRAYGDKGVLALVCDSTNALREGDSPSEQAVGESLKKLIEEAKGRVAVSTFSSNVGRIVAIARAARDAGRQVLVLGRSLKRAIDVAGELGYMDGLPEFIAEEDYGFIPRENLVVICTGSQGEPLAALAKLSRDEMKSVALTAGDTVIFSSRTIPGNEKAVGGIINGLVTQGVEIITDREHLVHVSGHPRRDELRDMISWVRPQLLIPVHGEALHLAEHAKLARAAGVPKVLTCRNGDLVKLGPGDPGIVGEVPSGRLYKDGTILEDSKSRAVVERRRMGFAGCAFVAIAMTAQGEMMDDPEVDLVGMPENNAAGELLDDIVFDVVVSTIEGLPKPRRRDPDALGESVRRAVRAALNEQWGKKPICVVHVLTV